MWKTIFVILYLFMNVVLGQVCDPDGCITFSVAAGTGCAWMCNYCQENLGTTNYYFTDGVCTYAPGGCQGDPQVGVDYTCCAN
jgi:hypothetical protein